MIETREMEVICGGCAGSGEGMHDGAICSTCKGMGSFSQEYDVSLCDKCGEEFEAGIYPAKCHICEKIYHDDCFVTNSLVCLECSKLIPAERQCDLEFIRNFAKERKR